MKILLINSPVRLDAEPSCIPYGLATVASTLKEEGFEGEIYDINALRPSKEEIIRSLKNMHWDIVGVSGLVTTYRFQRWIIPKLRTINPEAMIVSGGGLATSSSDLLFKNTDIDVAVLGEGEETILELCRTFEKSKSLSQVAGIRFRKNGQVVSNSARKSVKNLDVIPFPAWDLLPMEIYLNNPIWGDAAHNSSGFKKDVKVTRSMNIISSRGCPFSCNYCYHLFGRSNYRLRSPRNIVKEMELLVKEYGVDFIGFVDDNMMASETRLIEFCELMIEKRFPLSWGCHGRVNSAHPHILRLMAEAGCVWIGYGIESGSQRILNAMNKRATVAQAKKAISETRKAGIFPNTTFIFGYPGETLESIQETIDFKRQMALECGSFFATPYPGTPLFNQFLHRIEDEEAYIQTLGNATEFTINLTRFDDESLFRLKKAQDENLDVLLPQPSSSN